MSKFVEVNLIISKSYLVEIEDHENTNHAVDTVIMNSTDEWSDIESRIIDSQKHPINKQLYDEFLPLE